MALLRFFKVPKHQQYDYKPRYWNPKKEELEDRLRKIEHMNGDDAEAVKARISSGFRRGYSKESSGLRQRQVMRSNLVLIGIIIVLLLLSYLFLTVYLPQIVQAFEPAVEME